MSVIGNNSDTLLHTLSDFWLRYFRDVSDLQALYEGTEIVLGQAYLNLLSDVLNVSVVETPLFRREYFQLITAREDQLLYVDSGVPGKERYLLKTAQRYSTLPQLQNTVFKPTAALDYGLDFELTDEGILFIENPTAPVQNGYANRAVEVITGGSFTAPGMDWLAAGVRNGDRLVASHRDDVTRANPVSAVMYTVQHVTADKLYVAVSTPVPGILAAGYSWKIERTLSDGTELTGLPEEPSLTGVFSKDAAVRVTEVSFWAVDARVDEYTLYATFGHLFTDKKVSSESYRAFLRGVMQLYILGPAIDRVESALNVVANLPVIKNDGEVLVDYDLGLADLGSDGEISSGNVFYSPSAAFTIADLGGWITLKNGNSIGSYQIENVIDATTVAVGSVNPLISETDLDWEYSITDGQTITTTGGTYTYPRTIPIRADVKNAANVGTLTFKAFEALTTAVVVTDYVRDPFWWHSITIPSEMMPGVSVDRRTVTPALFANEIGDGSQAYVGDAGFYVGANEYGLVSTPTAPPFRHNAAFILMDRFLKMHTFSVKIDSSVDLSGALITDMYTMLKEVKPAHTNLYLQPVTNFKDIVGVADLLALAVGFGEFLEQVLQVDNTYRIGSTFPIGMGFKYSDAFGGAYTTAAPGNDYTALAIGLSQDPSILTGAGETNLIDRPVHLSIQAP